MEIESQAIHGIAKEVSSKIDDVHDSIMKKVDNLDDVNTANSVNSKEFGDNGNIKKTSA